MSSDRRGIIGYILGCPTCEKSVRAELDDCPHCGDPLDLFPEVSTLRNRPGRCYKCKAVVSPIQNTCGHCGAQTMPGKPPDDAPANLKTSAQFFFELARSVKGQHRRDTIEDPEKYRLYWGLYHLTKGLHKLAVKLSEATEGKGEA